jgi:peptidoglycan/LPS O-acetylase OafA/YrhL
VIQILKCFSLYDNFHKLVQIKEPHPDEDNFRMFNGIRVLSISWVVYGHLDLLMILSMRNPLSWVSVVETPGLMTLGAAAYYAVDVFFFIGGFLTSVLLVEKLRKMKEIRK